MNRQKHNKVIGQLAYDTKFVKPEALDQFIELQQELKPSRVARAERKAAEDHKKRKYND